MHGLAIANLYRKRLGRPAPRDEVTVLDSGAISHIPAVSGPSVVVSIDSKSNVTERVRIGGAARTAPVAPGACLVPTPRMPTLWSQHIRAERPVPFNPDLQGRMPHEDVVALAHHLGPTVQFVDTNMARVSSAAIVEGGADCHHRAVRRQRHRRPRVVAGGFAVDVRPQLGP